MPSPVEPDAHDVLYAISVLDAQTDLVMDKMCPCCRAHPVMKFTEERIETEELVTTEACIACDAIHLWPRLRWEEDACAQCNRCGNCMTHDCAGCPTREELLEMGYSEEEIDGTD
jgi:hypothetical protein